MTRPIEIYVILVTERDGMIDKIKQRLVELADQVEEAYKHKIECENKIQELDVRIAQLVGAMQELDSLTKGEEDESKEST